MVRFPSKPFALALHGGAGSLVPGPDAKNAAIPYKEVLRNALDHGWDLLASGANALDTVGEVVAILEDSPLYNAGRGSVLTAEGRVEMDAAIMCGKSLRAGAVAGVENIRNPVRAARAVLEDERYILLAGGGAQAYAEQQGIDFAPAEYFVTEGRIRELANAQKRGAISLDHEKFGTVGCVALDDQGSLAAATSTGGLTNKSYRRIGDSPLIGCGTYADKTAAISCTGYGEVFIRKVVAHEVTARMRLAKQSLEAAAQGVIHDELDAGTGGLIGVDPKGHIVFSFNTSAMFRAGRDALGYETIAIWEKS